MDVENICTCKHKVVGFCHFCQEDCKSQYYRHYKETSFEEENTDHRNYSFPVEFLRET